jgi:cytochrome o ubiquinol oxidase subunit 1
MFIGGLVIACGVALQVVQIIASVIQKRRLRDATGDPWNGRTLEWATASPPPFYNFATIEPVTTQDALTEIKKQGTPEPKYEDIHMPRNTGAGIYIAAFAFVASFALVWHINWLAIVGIIGIIVCAIARTFNDDVEYKIPAADIKAMEEQRKKDTPAAVPDRDEDMSLWDFIKIVLTWALDVVKKRRLKTW